MTNLLKFRVGNIGHACYLAVGVWLLNFCHSFSNFLGTFSSKMEFLRKWKKFFENRERRREKNGGWMKI